LQWRYQEALKKDADRRMEVQTPIKVLEALSTYLRDSLELVPKMKDIPVHNKRFMTSFGDDCDVLLNWLGFKKRAPGPEDNVEHELWQLPRPPPEEVFGDEGPRVLLEDVMEELHATMRNKPESEKALVKHKPPTPEAFDEKMRILLGMAEYEKGVLRRKRVDLSNDYLYAGLGAVQDFTTDLLIYAFRRQTEWDAAGAPYYYDCLTAISKKNASDDMNMALALLASEGFVSRAEVRDAYRYLGFEISDRVKLTDQDVLGHFESRLESSHHSHESELRERLKIIGKARGSSLLTNAAENGKCLSFISFPSSFPFEVITISQPTAIFHMPSRLSRVL
jgi:ubiquitin carboxyl-terminal hydrolase 25